MINTCDSDSDNEKSKDAKEPGTHTYVCTFVPTQYFRKESIQQHFQSPSQVDSNFRRMDSQNVTALQGIRRMDSNFDRMDSVAEWK